MTKHITITIITASLILTIVVPKVSAALIQFDPFSDSSSMTLNGSSHIHKTKLRLTGADNQTGSAFYQAPMAIDPTNGFSTWFQFQIQVNTGSNDVSGGLAFVLQSQGPQSQALGQGAGGLGYAGIAPGLAIEFDTFRNPWDPNGNHIGVNLNGCVVSRSAYYVPTPFDNGNVWNAWVELTSPRRFLEISVSENEYRPPFAQFSYLLDLADVFDASDKIFVGFTASSGGDPCTHDILSWRFDCNPNPVPLPGAFWLLLTAAASFIACREIRNLHIFLVSAADGRRHLARPTWLGKSYLRWAIENLPKGKVNNIRPGLSAIAYGDGGSAGYCLRVPAGSKSDRTEPGRTSDLSGRSSSSEA